MKIGIVAYENCTASMIAGMMDILALANTQVKGTRPLFEVTLLTDTGKPVNSFTQFPITPSASLRSRKDFDIVYIPGFLADPLQTIGEQKNLIAWLHAQFRKGVTLTAACNGNIFLAEAGILKGKDATTHWSLIDFFSKRYPEVCLKPERIIVDGGNVISAAGVTAYMNLALYIIARHGSPELASVCSKVFLVDSGRRIQTPYLIFSSPKNHGDDDIIRLQEWIEGHYQDSLTVESLMETSAMSRRTLVRRFKSATGDSPLGYVQRVRIENAKRFLETTNKTFSEITWEVGYNDISSFQRLFKFHTRLTPREYRDKFTLVAVR